MIHKLAPIVPFVLLVALVWALPALPVTSTSKARGPWVLTALPAIGMVTWRCQPVHDGELVALGFRAFADSATDRLELRAGDRLVVDRLVQPGQALRLPYLKPLHQQLLLTQSTEPGTLRAFVSVDFSPRPISPSHCWPYLPPGVTVRVLPR